MSRSPFNVCSSWPPVDMPLQSEIAISDQPCMYIEEAQIGSVDKDLPSDSRVAGDVSFHER